MLHACRLSLILCLFALTLQASIEEEQKHVWDLVVQLVETEDKGVRDPGQAAVLISDTNEKLLVSQEFTRKLLSLDSFGRMKRVDHAHRGHHPTCALGGIYFKSDTILPPLDPTMEVATYLFHSLLFGEGITPSRFIFVKNLKIRRFAEVCDPYQEVIDAIIEEKEEIFVDLHPSVLQCLIEESQNHLLQVSLAVEGYLGRQFIEDVEAHRKRLDEISLLDFQKHFITNLLLSPGDNKSENFIVTNGEKRLVFIDNDWQFCSNLKRVPENASLSSFIQEFGGCKNILFLLKPLMEKKIKQEIVDHILSIDPSLFLRSWLVKLSSMNQCLETIFRENSGFSERYRQNYMPLKFYKGSISDLLNKLIFLQRYLANPITCSELFKLMHKDLESYYARMIYEYGSYLRTLQKIYSNERPLTQGRISNARIGPKALKGRWLFNALDRLKRERTSSIEESLKELFHPVQVPKKTYAENWCDVLLKNIDDQLFTDTIAEEFTQALLNQKLPSSMKTQYPYNILEMIVEYALSKEGNIEALKPLILKFACMSRTYEDFILSSFKEKKQCPSYILGKGISKLLTTIEFSERP